MFGFKINKKTEEVIQKKVTKVEQPKDIMYEFAKSLGDIGNYEIDKEEEARMFKELESVDYLQEFLRAQISFDMQQYFAATTDEQRNIIKGRMARTAYIRSKLKNRDDHKVSPSKIGGLRYGRKK